MKSWRKKNRRSVAERYLKREASEQCEWPGEWPQRRSERVYCRIHEKSERKRGLVVYPQYTILFRIPLRLTIEKLWCRQKGITIEQLMQIVVNADIKSTERGKFQQKPPKKRSRGQICFGFQSQTFPWYCKAGKFQRKTWGKDEKKHSITRGDYTHQYKEVKEKL